MARDYAATIRGLLSKADRTDNEHEAQAFRDKAEAMMREYRIAEEEALAVDPDSATCIQHVMVIREHMRYGDLSTYYTEIFHQITVHTGVRYRINYDSNSRQQLATVIGYEMDVRYTEFLWTAAYLMFSTRIDPVWSSDRSLEENIFLLRNAGIERRKIADSAGWDGTQAAARSKVQRVYVREAERRGEAVRAAGLGFNTDTYRLAYANEFTETLRRRLQIARDAADSVGGGLVLHGRSDRVNEAFYAVYPDARPAPRTDTATAWVDPRTTCPKRACKEGRACRDHSYMLPRAWTKADEARFQRNTSSASAQAGKASGREAAESVTITRGHPTAARLDRSGNAIEA